MNETLEFPVIVEPAIEVVDAPTQPAESGLVLMRRNALAELSAVDRGIAALKAAHGAVDYDITTSKGLQAAKDHRLAVREARYRVPHIVKARKAELKTVTEALDAEAERITDALLAIEKPHDDAIKARELVLAEEKAERDRKEAERKAKHQTAIATIRTYLTHCQQPGMTAQRIAAGILALEAVPVGEEFEEFVDEAARAREETLAGMRTLHAQTLGREQEAERLERQRQENERAAAELAAERARIEAQAAEVRRQQAALDAQQRTTEVAAAVGAVGAPGQYPELPTQEQAEAESIQAAEAAIASAAASAKQVAVVEVDAPPPTDAPTVTLGELKAQIFGEAGAFTAAFVESVLGVTASRDGKALLYTQQQRQAILVALARRVEGLI